MLWIPSANEANTTRSKECDWCLLSDKEKDVDAHPLSQREKQGLFCNLYTFCRSKERKKEI